MPRTTAIFLIASFTQQFFADLVFVLRGDHIVSVVVGASHQAALAPCLKGIRVGFIARCRRLVSHGAPYFEPTLSYILALWRIR